MRKQHTLFFLLFLLSSVIYAQSTHWLTIEKASYDAISLQLQILHQPTLADEEWFRISIENNSTDPIDILNASLEVKIQAFGNSENPIRAGMFTNANPSDFFDNATPSLFGGSQLQKGKNTISKYPSVLGGSILEMPEKNYYRVEASLSFSVELGGDAPLSLNWEDIKFDFDWYRPKDTQIKQLQQQLHTLSLHPQYSSYQFHSIKSLLDCKEVTNKMNVRATLNALNAYKDYPEAKIAFLRYADAHFSKETDLLDYVEQKIKAKDLSVLSDLKEMPEVWKPSFEKALMTWFQEGNLGIKIRILDMLFLRREHWNKNKAFCEQLSNHLLKGEESIIYAIPDQLNSEELILWGRIATALGKTGDSSAIGILCPFLRSKTPLLGREMLLYTSSVQIPRPVRTCDVALEAILHLLNQDVEASYEKQGFLPPYFNGEVELVITRVRDNLIRDILVAGTCEFNPR